MIRKTNILGVDLKTDVMPSLVGGYNALSSAPDKRHEYGVTWIRKMCYYALGNRNGFLRWMVYSLFSKTLTGKNWKTPNITS